jgi:CTD small phosphatase-like protein 2
MRSDREFTLVLDLDETLVHYDEGNEQVYNRPGVSEFLYKMAEHYEIVIFTAGMQEYADWALGLIGDGQVAQRTISHRLYR